MQYYSLDTSIKDLVKAHRGAPAPPRVFVAYDFKDQDSEKFFADLRSALSHSQRDAAVELLNGRVGPGESWAVEVRDRIAKSRLVIADVSLNSLEVYFECGLAWGHGKTLCPVVRTSDRMVHVPNWLRDIQVVDYSKELKLDELLAKIRQSCADKPPRQRNRCEIAIPGKIEIVAMDAATLERQNAAVKAVCGQYGMEYTPSSQLTDKELSTELPVSISSASLLIINIDGKFSDSDLFGVFCTGAILSHPSSGVSSKKLLKQVRVVTHGKTAKLIKIFPDAAKRIPNVKIIEPKALDEELHAFGVSYRRWVALQSQDDKERSDAAKTRRQRRK